MSSFKPRDGAILFGTVIALLLPLIVFALYIGQKHQLAAAGLVELEPRHARLLGLEVQRAELHATLLRAQAARAQYVYPAAQDATQAGNAAQQRLRDIFTSAGLQVSSSQVLPSKVEKGFDLIPLTVRTEGELLALQSALAVLSSQAPVIIINELEVQVQGGLGNLAPFTGPRLTAQFSLSVLRERP